MFYKNSDEKKKISVKLIFFAIGKGKPPHIQNNFCFKVLVLPFTFI